MDMYMLVVVAVQVGMPVMVALVMWRLVRPIMDQEMPVVVAVVAVVALVDLGLLPAAAVASDLMAKVQMEQQVLVVRAMVLAVARVQVEQREQEVL
jgi:hypothetical protein